MEIKELYKIAEKEKISFFYDIMNDCNALYFSNCILLNKKILNTNIEKEVLAEELGHHFMGVLPSLPFSTDYYNKLIRSKNEFKALKWMVYKLIPFNKLKRFLKQNYSKFDLAEEFDVSISLIDNAMYIYNISNL